MERDQQAGITWKNEENEYLRLLAREQEARAEAEATTRRLKALLSITDTVLTHLALDDLLRELLGRIRGIMDIDYTAILLTSEDGRFLTVRAAPGLEEEIAPEVDVPIGRGFAGSIAAHAKPLIVEELSTVEIITPLLREKLRSMPGVPLLIEGRVIGVIHVGMASARRFAENDVQLLQRAADRIALAIAQSRLYEAEKRARAVASARAKELEATIDEMADGVFIYDGEARLLQANKMARELFALDIQPDYDTRPVRERVSQTLIRDEQGQLMPEDQWPMLRILKGEVLQGTNTMDVIIRALDGHDVRLSISGAPVRDSEERIIGGVLIVRDVTERRLLEQWTQDALNALLAMAEALVQVPGGADAADHVEEQDTDTLTAVSKVTQRLAELTCSVLGCRRVSISVVEPGTEIVRAVAVVGLTAEQEQQWWAEQRQQESSLGDSPAPELVSALRSNEMLFLDMRKPPYNELPNPYGVGVAVIVPMQVGDQLIGLLTFDYGGAEHEYTEQDIALTRAISKLAALVIERERLLHERAEAQANALALREANRRMDEFLGMASHELRTPLTTIQGTVQLAKRQLKNVERNTAANTVELDGKLAIVQALLERADRQAKLLNRLVGDLLDVTRIQANKLELHKGPCDLVAIVREAVEDQRQMSPSRLIHLEDLTSGQLPIIADAECLEQVVTNYLTNALKYSEVDRPVEVSVQVEEQAARISVRDEGPGLSATEQERVWERFYRVPGVEVKNGSRVGLGLGLHISRTIIERHGGQVGVQSSPGESSTFWFTLPMVQ